MLKIKVKYHDPKMPRLGQIDGGDCIDLRVVDIINLPQIRWQEKEQGWWVYSGDELFISLGVSIEVPDDYRCNIYPRSSLWKKHGLILTNSVGIIDNRYKGDNDMWKCWLYCIGRDNKTPSLLKKYERILQFEVVPRMKSVYIQEVEHLGNKNRGGFGATGKL